MNYGNPPLGIGKLMKRRLRENPTYPDDLVYRAAKGNAAVGHLVNIECFNFAREDGQAYVTDAVTVLKHYKLLAPTPDHHVYTLTKLGAAAVKAAALRLRSNWEDSLLHQAAMAQSADD